MIERVEADRTSLFLAGGLGCLIAIFLVLQPPVQVGLAFLGGAISILALFNRRAALYFIIPAMALSPEISLLGVPVRIEDLLIVPLIAGWLAHLCVFKERQRTSLDRLIVAYFLVGLMATLWGGYLGTSHFWTTDKEVSSPFHLLKRLEFVLLFFILVDTLSTASEVRSFAYVLIASTVALNLLGLGQFLSNHFMALGPLGVSGHEAGVASMIAAPLALSLIPASRPSARVLLGAIVLFSMAVLPLSLGRNFIAVTVLILLYVALFQQRWALVLLPMLLLIGLYLYPPHVLERVLTFQYAFSPGVRAEQADAAALVYRAAAPRYYGSLTLGHSPVLGFGVASLPLGFIDNEYVVQLVYTGLVGVAVFLLFGVRLIRLAKLTTTSAHGLLDACMARGFQLVLVAYALYSIFASSISPTHTGGFFFVIAGLIVVLYRSLSRPATDGGDST